MSIIENIQTIQPIIVEGCPRTFMPNQVGPYDMVITKDRVLVGSRVGSLMNGDPIGTLTITPEFKSTIGRINREAGFVPPKPKKKRAGAWIEKKVRNLR